MNKPRKFSGERLRMKRQAAELTQDELAALCGTSKQAISRYECGDSDPELPTVLKLAETLNCTVENLTA